MSIISIRLPEKLLHELDAQAQACKVPRTEYIRLAILHMNQEVKNKARRERLMKASLRTRKESMRVNAEFSEIENDLED
jgi:metal-responsive CopG/Arc/MetJ family transcriptional regulator